MRFTTDARFCDVRESGGAFRETIIGPGTSNRPERIVRGVVGREAVEWSAPTSTMAPNSREWIVQLATVGRGVTCADRRSTGQPS